MSAGPVGVRLGRYSPLRFYEAADLDLTPGDAVVVAGLKGEAVGTVGIAPSQLLGSEAPVQAQGRVVRRGSGEGTRGRGDARWQQRG